MGTLHPSILMTVCVARACWRTDASLLIMLSIGTYSHANLNAHFKAFG